MCSQCIIPEHEVLCRHVQALMLAASVDCTEGLSLLIKHGATIELQVNLYLDLQSKPGPSPCGTVRQQRYYSCHPRHVWSCPWAVLWAAVELQAWMCARLFRMR